MICLNYSIILLLFSILKKRYGLNTNRNIIIYNTENNYPRALRLKNSSNDIVLAFSGYKKGIISIYSNYAEEIQLNIPFVKYDSNVDILDINNNSFIMAWGKDTNINIVYFLLDNYNWKLTELNGDQYYSSTYKISVIPILPTNGNVDRVLIGWVNKKRLKIIKFKLEDFQIENKLYEKDIDNNFISCINLIYIPNTPTSPIKLILFNF